MPDALPKDFTIDDPLTTEEDMVIQALGQPAVRQVIAWASGLYPVDVKEALDLFAERYRWKP